MRGTIWVNVTGKNETLKCAKIALNRAQISRETNLD